MSTATIIEIKDRVRAMSESDQEKVLALIRGLTGAPRPKGMTGAEFIQSLPLFTKEEAMEMERAIEEGCEQVAPMSTPAPGSKTKA
jgi:hypothetical protein